MNKLTAYSLVIVLLLALGWLLLIWQPDAQQASRSKTSALPAPPEGGDFVLQSADGPVSLRDFRGQVVLLYFGYTWCPDVCPTSLGFISTALRSLDPGEQRQVQGLFISVDPKRDSLQHLKDYTAFFGADILGVTGASEALADVAARYGAAYRIVQDTHSAAGYSVDHSSQTYLIDAQGTLRKSLAHGTPPHEISLQVRRLLQE